jgi:hypothetical protein
MGETRFVHDNRGPKLAAWLQTKHIDMPNHSLASKTGWYSPASPLLPLWQPDAESSSIVSRGIFGGK